MPNDDAQPVDLPEEKEPTVESGDAPLVLQGESLPPAVPTPHALTRGLRLLRERIPDFTHLSVEEERSMIRASYLDPEFIADAILASENWESARIHAGMTAEEMHELDAAILHWDALEKEWLVTAKGIAGANRKRRFRLGRASLDVYFALGMAIKRPENSHLRPVLRANEALLHEEPQVSRESPESRRRCRHSGRRGQALGRDVAGPRRRSRPDPHVRRGVFSAGCFSPFSGPASVHPGPVRRP